MQLGKRTKIVSVILALALMASIVFAALQYTSVIDNTANVRGYKIALWNTLTDTEINAIPRGDLDYNIPKKPKWSSLLFITQT